MQDFLKPHATRSTITPSAALSNKLSTFFQEKVQSIYSSFPMSETQTTTSLSLVHSSSWAECRPFCPRSSLLDLERIKSGSPLDPCPARFFKLLAPFFNPYLNVIWNSSLTSGSYPSIWKNAHVLPILKKMLTQVFSRHFRPISLLLKFWGKKFRGN